jgi:hypothetical protein
VLVITCWPPEIPVSLMAVLGTSAFLEPYMLIASMVDDEVKDDLHVVLVTCIHEGFNVFHGSVRRIYVLVNLLCHSPYRLVES